jgi:uncharacterized protein (DUF342 family)
MTKEQQQSLISEGYSQDQVEEIREGLDAGLDVSSYMNKNFYAIQMRQIRLGLTYNLNVSIYATTDFDWFQMEEIRKGLLQKLDVSIYAKPGIPYDKMRQLREGLAQGINMIDFVSCNAGILRELRMAVVQKVNIFDYIKQGYDDEQLEEIRKALVNGVNIAPYLNKEFRGVSIGEIREGLEKGLDVSVYARIDLGWRQMREIRLGLENRADINLYCNPLYSWRQMREIRLGLENGLDVSSYKSLMYTSDDMKKKRLRLMEDKGAGIISEKAGTFEFDGFALVITPDEMMVTVEVRSTTKSIPEAQLREALRRCSITKGIMEDTLHKLTEEAVFGRTVVIAQGMSARKGKDGWYEFFFRTDMDKKVQEDDTVDYDNVRWFELVKAGDRIAYYHPAEKGVNGYTVRGRELLAKKGREASVLTGKGFMLMPDERTYLASENGRIELEHNNMIISKVLVLDEVTPLSGNISFEGSIYVKGNVGTGSVVKATGDIVIDGHVESAIVESGRDVLLRNGINANHCGQIKAAGSVYAKFIETATVVAEEDIYSSSCLNSDLQGMNISVCTQNGTFAGGTAYAAQSMRLYHAGNRAGLGTTIRLGTDAKIREQLFHINKEIEEIRKELNIFGNAYMEIQKKYPPEMRNTMDVYIKVEKAIYTKEKQMEQVLMDKQNIEKKIQTMSAATLVILGTVYEGTVVWINGKSWIGYGMNNINLKMVHDKIALYTN